MGVQRQGSSCCSRRALAAASSEGETVGIQSGQIGDWVTRWSKRTRVQAMAYDWSFTLRAGLCAMAGTAGILPQLSN